MKKCKDCFHMNVMAIEKKDEDETLEKSNCIKKKAYILKHGKTCKYFLERDLTRHKEA